MDEYIIESENGKLWYGGGAWTDQRDRAKRYPSKDAANAEYGKFGMKGNVISFASRGSDIDTTDAAGDNDTNASE